MAGKGASVVLFAVLGNGTLTAIKFVAFLFSGSGAMFSEAIHSAADTGNQALLFLGARRSERPPDQMFHYGYGSERFLFSLLAALGIFVLGCGVTVYHGVRGLLHPHSLELDWITFAVLGVSFVLEFIVLVKAVKAVSANRGDTPFVEFVRTSSDPTLLAVLFEDSIACLGVLIAAVGIALAYLTENPVFDSLASIVIGLMLGAVAIWLALRNRQLILGPAIPHNMEAAIVKLIQDQPSVTSVHDIKSRIVAAGRFRLKAEIDYDAEHLAKQHVAWVNKRLPDLVDEAAVEQFVGEFGDRVLKSLADEIDRIEEKVAESFPDLRYLDLESHVEPEA